MVVSPKGIDAKNRPEIDKVSGQETYGKPHHSAHKLVHFAYFNEKLQMKDSINSNKTRCMTPSSAAFRINKPNQEGSGGGRISPSSDGVSSRSLKQSLREAMGVATPGPEKIGKAETKEERKVLRNPVLKFNDPDLQYMRLKRPSEKNSEEP